MNKLFKTVILLILCSLNGQLFAQMEGVFVSKYLLNRQIDASTTITDGTLFEAEVSISGYSPSSFTIDGSSYSLSSGRYENGDQNDSGSLDFAFGNSSEYSFTNPDGGSASYTFTPSSNGSFHFDYPSTPTLALAGGSWDNPNERYIINKNDSLEVTTNSPATNDAQFKMSFIEIYGDGDFSQDLAEPHFSFDMDTLGLDPVATNTDKLQSNSVDLGGYSLGTYEIEVIQMHGYELTDLSGIGGDWNGIGMFALGSITVIELEVVPEPSQAALLIGIVAIAMVGLRRRVNFS